MHDPSFKLNLMHCKVLGKICLYIIKISRKTSQLEMPCCEIDDKWHTRARLDRPACMILGSWSRNQLSVHELQRQQRKNIRDFEETKEEARREHESAYTTRGACASYTCAMKQEGKGRRTCVSVSGRRDYLLNFFHAQNGAWGDVM